jgi:hypothetical protein
LISEKFLVEQPFYVEIILRHFLSNGLAQKLALANFFIFFIIDHLLKLKSLDAAVTK